MASAKEIPPGGEGKIEVTFKTKGKHGNQKKKITVKTNDPDTPTVHLTVSAHVVVQFGFKPLRINFGRIQEGTLPSKILTAIGEKMETASIQSVSVANKTHTGYYTITINDSGRGAGRTLQLVVTPTEAIPIGRFFDQLTVKTDLPESDPVLVRISGERVGPVEAFPRSMILKKSPEGVLSGSILLRSANKREFQVLLATCRDPRATVSFHPVKAAGNVTIEARLPETFQDPVFRSELIIKIDQDKQFDLKVPIYITDPPSPPPGQAPPFPPQGKGDLPWGHLPPPPPQ